MEMNDYLKRVQTNLVVDDKITLKNEACSYINNVDGVIDDSECKCLWGAAICTGASRPGDYSLDIRDVSLDDDAMYQCQVSTGLKGEPAIRSRYARLTVLVPPDPPKILRGPVLQTVEDRDVDLECVSVGGKPAAEITWVDNEGGVLSQGVTYTVEEMSDGRRFTARYNSLHIISNISRSFNSATIRCEVHNIVGRSSETKTLEIVYGPSFRTRPQNVEGELGTRPPKIISNETQYGVEGDSVRIECTSFSVPKPSHVIWAYQGNEINSFHNQEYVFLEESLADRLTKSTLIVRNSAPKHFESASLLLITCGASSVAILVLIIMLVTMLCHRKNNKCDVKKPDIDDMKSDRNSNVSDLKFELRQVEGSCEMDTEELHPTLQLTTNLGLPLAGPVPLPEPGYDMKYQRYSGDFTQINMPFKVKYIIIIIKNFNII
ncbi:unnamed protein product [Leptidea sinapis]|uniref:Ig-like domain-containing protein n=1 Tax=Leptidea sinapis TaxID=189913 RepID=A0A5E4QH30_9NEOP|nr:unnamed protein product [Leptidea sinapis]